MLPYPKAHGCILFHYVFKAQAAQLAISDSCSGLQEQEHNQGQVVHCKRFLRDVQTKSLKMRLETHAFQTHAFLDACVSKRMRFQTHAFPDASLPSGL